MDFAQLSRKKIKFHQRIGIGPMHLMVYRISQFLSYQIIRIQALALQFAQDVCFENASGVPILPNSTIAAPNSVVEPAFPARALNAA